VRRLPVLLLATLLIPACGDDDPTEVAANPPATGDDETRYEFVGTVLESGDHGPELCLGGVAESLPPQCGGLPVDPWSWDDVADAQSAAGTTWAELRVVGTYDGAVLHPTETPEPAPTIDPAVDFMADFPELCAPEVAEPARTTQDDFDATLAAADGLPGRAALWVSHGDRPVAEQVLNVIVAEDGAGATETLRATWGGGLCVVERPEAPTEARLADIQSRLADVLGVDVWASWPDTQRGLVVAQVTLATDELRAAADAELGPGLVELTGALKPL